MLRFGEPFKRFSLTPLFLPYRELNSAIPYKVKNKNHKKLRKRGGLYGTGTVSYTHLTITEEASVKLTELFQFNIPQRWSIAHLYQAILNGEDHVKNISFQTTLAGYVHWMLTGEKAMGVGEASGCLLYTSRAGFHERGN